MANTISKHVQSIEQEIRNHGSDNTFNLEEYIKQNYPSLLRIPRSKINQKLVEIGSQLKTIGNTTDAQELKDSLIAQEKIWSALLVLRKELYSNPKYPMEANVAEAGAFSVSKRRKKATSGIVERKGRTASIRYYEGAELTVADAKVLLAVQKLWEEKGKTQELELTLYEIAQKLNRQVGGKTYSDIRESLLSLFRAEVRFEDFLLNGQKVKTSYIHLLEALTDFEKGDKVKFSFTNVVFKSLLAGYFINVSMALLEDLSSSAAQGLYPFIALQTARGNTEWYVVELYTLVNIASERPNKRRKSLEEALEDLQKSEIILDFRFYFDESDSEKVAITPSAILKNCLPPQSAIDSNRQLTLPLFDQVF